VGSLRSRGRGALKSDVDGQATRTTVTIARARMTSLASGRVRTAARRDAGLREPRIWAPLIALGTGLVVLFAVLLVLGDLTVPVVSLLGTTAACLAALVVICQAHYVRWMEPSFAVLVISVFLLKTGVGVAHYLYFFEPHYFAKPLGFFPWIYDYAQLPLGMQEVRAHWNTFGFSTLPETTLVGKSYLLVVYHALLYKLAGDHFLNFVPFSSFHTVLVAFLVTSLALQRGANRQQARAVFMLAALQPLFLYSDLPQRDIVGQLFVVLAVYLLVHSLNKVRRAAVALPIAVVLGYAQRTVYPFLLLVYELLLHLLARRRAVTALLIFGVSLWIWTTWGESIGRMTVGLYGETLPTTTMDRLPAAITVGVVGPFPWTQVLNDRETMIHLPPSLLQAWFGVVLWLIVGPRAWRQWRTTRSVDELVLASLLFTISGMMTTATHTGYVHIATVLVLPVACWASAREWAAKVQVSLALYLIGHVVFFAAGLGGRGVFAR
jgi:hypothetical protein